MHRDSRLTDAKTGAISREQLELYLAQQGFAGAIAVSIFETLDENGDGVLTGCEPHTTTQQTNEEGPSFCCCNPVRDDGFDSSPFSGQKLQLPIHER